MALTEGWQKRRDLQGFLALVKAGKLFAVQDWIKAGKPIPLPRKPDKTNHPLYVAVQTGFHSMVEALLQASSWAPDQLTNALEIARADKRFDIADLLLAKGAQTRLIDFQTCCTNLDIPMMERHLRSGTDPGKDNDFAIALSRVKAPPLLKFFMDFRAEFPALEDQAALALTDAVQQNQVRWVALLAWAGADPFRPTPCDLSGSFPVDPENCTCAAREALFGNNTDMLKVLRLNPTPSQAAALLKQTYYKSDLSLFRSFLSKTNPTEINDTPLGGSSTLDALLHRRVDQSAWRADSESKEETDTLQCFELLLDAGAKWRPTTEEIRYARRALLKHHSRYIVQILRLLLYTPGAVLIPEFLELCRSQSLASQIAVVDPYLHEELKELRKSNLVVSASGAEAKTDTAPAVGAPQHTSPPVEPAAG